MHTDTRTLLALLKEGLSPKKALAEGRVTVDGDPKALERFLSLFRTSVAA